MQLPVADGNCLWQMNADGWVLDSNSLRLLCSSEYYIQTSASSLATGPATHHLLGAVMITASDSYAQH